MIKKLVILAAILFVANKIYQNAASKTSDKKAFTNPGGHTIILEANPDLPAEVKKSGSGAKKLDVFL